MRIRAPGFRVYSSYDVAFSDCGRFLATVGRRVTIWDVATRVALHRNGLVRHPSSVAFAPDSTSYVIKATSGELLVCSTAHGDPISRYRPRPPAEGPRATFSADGRHVLDGSWDGRIALRRVEGLRELFAETFPQTMVVDATQSRDRAVWAFAIAPKHDHPTQTSGGWVELRRWRWQPIVGLHAPRGLDNLNRAQLSPDGTRIACVHGFFAVTIFDLATGREIATAALSRGGTGQDLAWSPDGRVLGVVQDRCFTFLATATLGEIARVADEYPSAVDFGPDGRLVALGSWDKGQVIPLADLLAAEHIAQPNSPGHG